MPFRTPAIASAAAHVCVFAALLVLAIGASLVSPAPLGAHERESDRDASGSSRAHLVADGLDGSGTSVKRRTQQRQRAIARQQRILEARARRLGQSVLTAQQIRERVLMQSLGVSLGGTQAGFVSATSAVQVDSRSGLPIRPAVATQSQMLASGALRVAESADAPASVGAWSDPVQPSYATRDADLANGILGDPIIDVDQPFTYDGAESTTDNARYWSPNPRIVPVFTALMPDGKVLYWDWLISGDLYDSDEHNNYPSTRILLWDPSSPHLPGERLDVIGANLFCAGYSHLPNGDLLLAGGNTGQAMAGLDHTWIYRWRSKQWVQGETMDRKRWYPSVTSLANGESLILGGDPQNEDASDPYYLPGKAFPEVYSSNFESASTQRWDPDSPADQLRGLTNLLFGPGDPTPPSWRVYPHTMPSLDGRVLFAGPETEMMLIDPRGAGDFQRFGPRDDGDTPIHREFGSAATFDRGRTLISGGGRSARYGDFIPNRPTPDSDECLDADGEIAENEYDCVGTNTPIEGEENEFGATDSAALIETVGEGRANDDQGMPTSRQAARMNFTRRLHALTALPDGTVLATGGMLDTTPDPDPTTDANNADKNNDLVDESAAVFAAEIWDPETDQWTVMAAAQKVREYHSTALLLPDGRVLVGGGGVCGACYEKQYSEGNFEFFSPPYLFNADGSTRGPQQRPSITTPTTNDSGAQLLAAIEFDEVFNLAVAEAASEAEIERVSLVKLGAPTHSIDQGQRLVPLSFERVSDQLLRIESPANAFEASPGFYMLFLVDADGVPSVAKVVQVGAALPLANQTSAAKASASTAQAGDSQDFGLGSFSAAAAHLAPVGDNAIRSLSVEDGYHATVCRGEDQSDCADVQAGQYDEIGTKFDRKISSLTVKEGAISETDPRFLDQSPDDEPPTISVTSPEQDSTQEQDIATLEFSVEDEVDEAPSCNLENGTLLALVAGENLIELRCGDAAGNEAVFVVRVIVGNVGPTDATPPVDPTPPTVPPAPPPITPPNAPPARPPLAQPAERVRMRVRRRAPLKRRLTTRVRCPNGCTVRMRVALNHRWYSLRTVRLGPGKKTRTVRFKVRKSLRRSIRRARNRNRRVIYKATLTSRGGSRMAAAGRFR